MLPNKLIKYQESVIPKAGYIIKVLTLFTEISVLELYKKTIKHVEDVNQYLDSLCFLFAIGSVEYSEGKIKLC